ncbi:MAG: cell wall metabolism sensor histidine kinase WalK [Armatimonadetes bacterium]|nr:cell wall metabolism sensor histidine kinase WalK [Armatimonadota bacterium]
MTSRRIAEPSAARDPLSGLLLLSSVHQRITEGLQKNGEIGFLFFDVVQFRRLQATYGQEACDALLGLLGSTFQDLRGILYRDEDLVAVEVSGGDYFVLFLFSPPRRKATFSSHDLKLIRHRIIARVLDIVNEERVALGIDEPVDLHSGYTIIHGSGRKRAPRVIADAKKEAALKAQLEEVMVGFISNVSHELRTPLTCIEGYAETLLEGAMAEPELCRRWLQIIYDEAQRLERLIKDLLDLSSMEARQVQIRPRAMNLEKAIRDTADVLHPHAQKSEVSVEVDVPNALPAVLADEDRIRQVLLILLDNGIKYSKSPGKVRIRARQRDGHVEVAVIDQGLGIPKADLERIFERFYRVDKGRAARRGGRGLGLAIAKHFIEAHGSTITVKSELDKGSAFQFSLPVDTSEEEDG